MAVVGAGPLTSHVWKVATSDQGYRYEFNVFWVKADDGRVAQRYRPRHVRDLVKLCRVLTSVMLDDGWLSPRLRAELHELEQELAQLTCCRSEDE